VWSWASYFLIEHYKVSDSAASVYAIAFDVCGASANHRGTSDDSF